MDNGHLVLQSYRVPLFSGVYFKRTELICMKKISLAVQALPLHRRGPVPPRPVDQARHPRRRAPPGWRFRRKAGRVAKPGGDDLVKAVDVDQ